MALDAGETLLSIYNGIIAHAQSTSGVLIGDGQDLAGILLLISSSWIVVAWLLSGDGSTALMDAFGVISKYSIVTMLLAGWLGTVGGFFQSNVNDLSQKVAGTSSVDGSINLMLGAAKKLFVSAEYDSRSSKCKEVEVSDPMTGTISSGVQCENTTRGAEPTWSDILLNFPMIMFTWLFKLLALVFLMLATTAFLLTIFIAEVLFGLALTMGPILVPWLIWQRMEWLFDGWLRFTIGACLTKVVAFFMVGITAGIITAAKTVADVANVKSGSEMLAVDEMAAFLICICAAISAFLMWQVPGIAQGLISGSSGSSAQKFGQGGTGKSIGKFPGAAIKGGASQLEAFEKTMKGGK